MTKIAISPNANGTGTFTIAAPDSNTDRTLTLPDAGGEVFSQGNIIGTVSESTGVPTGAILESGSNANGRFTKFADGTMICSISDARMTRNTTAQIEYSWTFPAAFVARPSLVNTRSGVSANTAPTITMQIPSAFVSSASNGFLSYLRVTGASNYAANDFMDTSGIAIGRWF